MAKRHSRAVLLLVLGASLAAMLVAADTPPTELKFVGGHWTAWDPPATPEGAQIYVIEPGDTFWGLASRHLGNPYLWPQLWERNQYVRDAHWIYPGDPLQLDVQVTPPGAIGAATQPSPGEYGGASGTAGGSAGEAMAGGEPAMGSAAPEAPGTWGEGEAGEVSDVAPARGSGASEFSAATEPGGGAAGAGQGTAGTDPGAGAGTGRGTTGTYQGTAGAGQGTAAGTAGTGGAAPGPALAGLAPSGGKATAPVPLGTQDDIYCSGFIGDVDEPFGYSIVGSEYEVLSPQMENPIYGSVEGILGTVDTVKFRLTAGDIVYLDGGRAGGLSPGMLLTAVFPVGLVRHPITREVVGEQFNYMGRVRVLTAQESTAIAEIVQSCSGIVVGMKLKLFEPEPIPLARRTAVRPVNDPTSGEALADAPVIVSSPVNLVSIGQDHVVFIDRGEDDEVYPGDIFTIYRVNRPTLPPVVLGELAVLSVQRHTAVARIIESRFPVYVGDRLERK